MFAPEVADDGIHDERCELPADNHEFVTPGERSANFVGCKFGEEHGYYCGCASHSEPEHRAAHQQYSNAGGEDACERARDEED